MGEEAGMSAEGASVPSQPLLPRPPGPLTRCAEKTSDTYMLPARMPS